MNTNEVSMNEYYDIYSTDKGRDTSRSLTRFFEVVKRVLGNSLAGV